MKTIYLLIVILFYQNLYSQADFKIKIDTCLWGNTNSSKSTLKIYVTINPVGEPFEWYGNLSGFYLDNGNNKIYPENVYKILKDDLTNITSALLVYSIEKPISKLYLNRTELSDNQKIEIPVKYYIADDNKNAKVSKSQITENNSNTNTNKNFYESAMDKGSYSIKFLFSINDAGAKTVNSLGFNIGLYPKLFAFGKSRDISIYAGWSVSALYMLSKGSNLSQMNSFYNINNNEYLLSGPDSLNQGFIFVGGGLMLGYKIKNIIPIVKINAGSYKIYLHDLKIYDVKNGKSSNDPSFWNFGFEFETGVNFYRALFIGYTLNMFKMNKSEINFLNKNYLFHTFSIGLMGI